MLDEHFDRGYATARAQLNADIDRALHHLARTVGISLKALHRAEWNAPWKHQQQRRA